MVLRISRRHGAMRTFPDFQMFLFGVPVALPFPFTNYFQFFRPHAVILSPRDCCQWGLMPEAKLMPPGQQSRGSKSQHVDRGKLETIGILFLVCGQIFFLEGGGVMDGYPRVCGQNFWVFVVKFFVCRQTMFFKEQMYWIQQYLSLYMGTNPTVNPKKKQITVAL